MSSLGAESTRAALTLRTAPALAKPMAPIEAELDGQTRPNIIVLMLDDYPAMDDRVLARLPRISSEFLDRSLSFENYWANFSLCCPGRATFLTGQEAHHHGVTKNVATPFDPSSSLATELQDLGYYTNICGKYFNGTRRLADKTPLGWSNTAIKEAGQYYDYPAWINGQREYHGTRIADYSTDVMAAKCRAFLADAPTNNPLFVLLTPNATHGGFDDDHVKSEWFPVPAPRHRGDARCVGIPPWKPANYNELDVTDKPTYMSQSALVEYSNGWPLERVCESLLSVDESFGRIVDVLKAQGRYDDTIFVLTSDNGMGWGAHRWKGKVAPHTARIPLYISWPSVVDAEFTADHTLLSNVDLAPTLCELAGCSMGPFGNGFGVDGMSFAGLINAESYSSVPRRTAILMEGGSVAVPPFRAIMTSADHPRGTWYFIVYTGGRGRELYDMSSGPCVDWHVGQPGDPCMMRNVAYSADTKAVRRSLRTQLNAMW